ncbi:hypothetical protein E0H26_20620 [Micromonospora zingiberis]|uniref:Uncharacterized protein n=1 Tax=Micromonospora zingiberis TaxID=2053011 RepID=A0A4R0GIS3_9ACTN|nr:hypothetical protein [Micromonospora zingiberis]TCB95349.1 hypothetical protein E0H26_20620 [Micromonospora zingiberis]
MIWIIESKSKLSRVFAADLKRLRANAAVAAHVTRSVLNSTIAQMQTPLAPALAPGEPVLVLAHSGYDVDPRSQQEAPWVGGRWLDEFAQDVALKFTPAGLSGRTLWFLVCHTGNDVTTLANHLAAAGVNNVTIYMPTDFMYISNTGIPHVLLSEADLESVNKDVARCDSDYLSIQGSQPTGSYWAGCTINGQVVTKLPTSAVEAAVQAQFDPSEEEA